MAFTNSNQNSSSQAMSSMNVTPLVDVMLVLLIIFMVTAPLMSYQLQLDLPHAGPPPIDDQTAPDPIRLRIDEAGQLFWNDTPLPKSALAPSLMIEGSRAVQATLEVDASPDTTYQAFTGVLAEAKNARMQKIGFVDEH